MFESGLLVRSVVSRPAWIALYRSARTCSIVWSSRPSAVCRCFANETSLSDCVMTYANGNMTIASRLIAMVSSMMVKPSAPALVRASARRRPRSAGIRTYSFHPSEVS
jgi:hypothetical protein